MFDSFLRELATGSTPSDSVYESFYDLTDKRWKSWQTQVNEYVQPVPFNFSKIIVPTSDNMLYSYLLKTVVGSGRPVLFVGEPGTELHGSDGTGYGQGGGEEGFGQTCTSPCMSLGVKGISMVIPM